MSFKLDLSKVKHVKSDDKTTTLQHKDGHLITLVHGMLHPDGQAQLKALSGVAKQAQTPDQTNAMRDQKMADGGKVDQKPAYRSELEKPIETPKENTLDYNKIRQEKRDMNRKEASLPPKRKMLADGGDPDVAPATEDSVPDQAPDFGGVKTIIPPQDAKPAEVPKDRLETQRIYNQLQGGNTPSALVSPGSGDEQKQFKLFGPNGEPPKAFDSKVWQQAESQIQDQQADAQGADQAKLKELQQNRAQIDADNQVRARAGLPPITPPDMPNIGVQVPTHTMPQQGSMADMPPAQSAADGMGQSAQSAEGLMAQGYQNKASGIGAEAKAQGALGQAQAGLLQKQQEAQQTAQDTYKQSFDALDSERKAHMADIQNGHIDPDQYWKGHDDGHGNMVGGHSKIMTMLGMLISGFNPAGRPGNGALDTMKYLMEQNINAQKTNLDSNQNLLQANLRQFGNVKDAADMTRLMQSDIIQSQLAQAAAQSQDPMAKARAQQAIGDLKMTYAPIAQQFAMRRAMMSLANQGANPQAVDHMLGYMRVMNPEMAKEMESRYVPGVGLASTPIAQEVRDKLVAGQTLQNTANDVLNYAKTHTNIIPGTAEYNIGVQKAAILQQRIREGLLGTVFRESEKPLLNQFVSNNPAGALKALNSEPKLRTIIQANNDQMNILKQSVGLPAAKQAADPQFKVVNGVRFMRGPNGQAIQVPNDKAK